MQMKKPLLHFVFFFSLLIPIINSAQAPNLGTASSFAVFTSAGTFTNDGTTNITGNIGTHVGALTGFPPGIVYGQTHVANATSLQCSTDVATAYTELASRTCGAVISVTLGNSQTLTPGTYCTGAASTLNGTLILDGQGDPNAVFIFQIGGAFSTSASSNISLINSATLCNVYWQVGGAFSLGASSVFRGAVLVNGAVSLLEGSAIYGQVLTKAGAIDLHNNIVLKSAIPIGYTHSWSGSSNTDWNNAGNWCPTSVPTIANGAYIHFVNNQPTIASSSYSVNNIGIDSLAVLTINSNATLAITNSIISEGNIVGLGNLIKNGSIADTISGIVTIANLTINNTAGTSIISGSANAVSVSDSLTVTGALTTNANLTLTSTSNGTARVAESSGSINGLVTVQRYIPAKRAFRFLTSPVTTSTSIKANWQEGSNSSTNNPNAGYGIQITGNVIDQTNGFDGTITGSPSVFTYGPTQSWASLTNTNVLTLNAGTGYRVFVRGSRSTNLTSNTPTATNTILRSTGTLKTSTVILNIGSTPALASGNGEFTLIGNPYMSPINWNTIGKTNVSGTYYIWDPTLTGTNGRGAYVSYNGTTNNNVSSFVSQHIQSSQAFFVENSAASPVLTFNESDKTATSTASFREVSNSPKLSVQLFMPNMQGIGTSADGAVVVFNNSFSKSKTYEDAAKFTNLDENLAIKVGASLVSIEGRPEITETDTIFLQTWQVNPNVYTLQFDLSKFETQSINNVFVEDVVLKKKYTLSLSGTSIVPYEVTTDVSTQITNRFHIVFEVAKAIPITNLKVTLVPNPSTDFVQVKMQSPKAELTSIRIVGVDGKIIESLNFGSVDQINRQISVKRFVAGTYLLQVVHGKEVMTEKIIKQ